jgi:sporulation protein YlmC with PRC-barrel domain
MSMKTRNRIETHFTPTSQLKLYNVVNKNGEDLGQVQNFIVDMCGARIAYVLVAFEGFLGLGDKWIPIPFEALEWIPEKHRFIMDFPRNRMEKAPTMSKSDWPDKFLQQLELQDHSDWLERVYNYWDCTPYWIVHEGEPCAPEASRPVMMETVTYARPEPPSAEAVRHVQVSAVPVKMPMKENTMKKMDTHFIPTSRLQSYDVVNDTGEELGKVERIIVDMTSGRVAYMLVGLKGHLNDRWVAVPPEAMTWQPAKKDFQLNVSRQVLENAPIIPKADWPDKFLMDLEKSDHLDWLENVYGHYHLTPFWIVVET